MRKISFSNYIGKFIHNIEELELPYASTYKLLKNVKDMKLQEKMIAQKDVPHEKKLFNVFAIDSETCKTTKTIVDINNEEKTDKVVEKTSYILTLWIRIINPRFKCRRYIYPGDYIVELRYNPYGGWELKFYQDSCDRYGDHDLEKAEHPHIQAGKGCFGGHKTAIDNALWSANFFGACKLIRKYIEEYNGRDTYTRGKHFDKTTGELTIPPERYGYVTNGTYLTEREKDDYKTFLPIEFDTYRVKRKFITLFQGRYYTSCFNKEKDIFNLFQFFNIAGRFEDGREGFPLEQTFEILKAFREANPYNITNSDGSRDYNPLWKIFEQKEAVQHQLKKTIPLFKEMYNKGYKMIYNNGGYYLNMRFRLEPEQLEALQKPYTWIGNQIMGPNDNAPRIACVKWLTQNIGIFIDKSEEMIESSTKEFSYDLTKEIEATAPRTDHLLEGATKAFGELEEELESLKLIVNKEKLNYLERERRKVLNEINNNTAKPETHQLSLGSL